MAAPPARPAPGPGGRAVVCAMRAHAPSRPGDAAPRPTGAESRAPRPVRILIADDHPVVLFALENLLGRFPDLRVVGRAHTFSELFDEADRLDFDVALVDLHMPCADHHDARATLDRFRQRFTGASLVVLTTEANPVALQRVLLVQIDGLLSKQDPIDLIPQAIAAALARERYIGPAVRDLLACGLPVAPRANPYRSLSNREREVLTLYAAGMSVTRIARQLGRSIKTISAQKCSAMRKLSLSNDIDLYRFLAESGIAPGTRSSADG